MTAQAPGASDANRGRMRTYARTGSAVFCKTKERYGGLSNMAGGFPLCVNGVRIRTSEALYQACRFPHRPEAQRLIIDQRSPMAAKMESDPHRHDSRGDWTRVRVPIMRWCLRVKLAQHWDAFGELLRSTDEELRELVRSEPRENFLLVEPLKIPEFLLDGCPIERVTAGPLGRTTPAAPDAPDRVSLVATAPAAGQLPPSGSSPKGGPVRAEAFARISDG